MLGTAAEVAIPGTLPGPGPVGHVAARIIQAEHIDAGNRAVFHKEQVFDEVILQITEAQHRITRSELETHFIHRIAVQPSSRPGGIIPVTVEG